MSNDLTRQEKIALLLEKMGILKPYTERPDLVLTHSAMPVLRDRKKPCEINPSLCRNNGGSKKPCTSSGESCETEQSLFVKAASMKVQEILNTLTDERLDRLLKEQELINEYGADNVSSIEILLIEIPADSLKDLIDEIAELSYNGQPRLIPTRNNIHNALADIVKKKKLY